MAKVNRNGQATPLSKGHYLKLRKSACTSLHQLFLDLAWYTGERPGAILKLRVGDVYKDPFRRLAREQILFRAGNRKDKVARICPVSDDLRSRLKQFSPGLEDEWLFPSPLLLDDHLCLRSIDAAFRRMIGRSGLEGLGYCLYSFRRGCLTHLVNQGYSLRTIQQFSGHKSLNNLARYLEVSDRQVGEMISSL